MFPLHMMRGGGIGDIAIIQSGVSGSYVFKDGRVQKVPGEKMLNDYLSHFFEIIFNFL